MNNNMNQIESLLTSLFHNKTITNNSNSNSDSFSIITSKQSSSSSSLTSILTNFGLTDKQAKVYLALLELSSALPSTISRKSGLKRPTVYVILEQLQEKGLVGHLKKGNSLFFTAVDPKALVEDQKRKVNLKRKP